MCNMTNPDKIIDQVLSYYNIPLEILKSPVRTQGIAMARHLAMFLVRKYSNLSYPEIAKLFNRNDHTTVMHAEKNINYLRKNNKNLEDDIQQIEINIQKLKEDKEEYNEIIEKKYEEKLYSKENIEILNKKIADVVYLSVRTSNCLRDENIIYFKDLVFKNSHELMQFRNFGRNSLNEIEEILNKFNLRLGMKIDTNINLFSEDSIEKKDNINENIIYLDQISLREISEDEFKKLNIDVNTIGFSVRTENVLKTLNLKKVGDLIQINERILLQQKNCGRKSVYEIRDYLLSLGFNFNLKLINWNNKNIEKYSADTVEIKDFTHVTIEEEFKKYFTVLSERELDVIQKRYGIDYDKYFTLEDIGREQNITRERIRQIESKGLRKIKKQFSNDLKELLKAKKNILWAKLSENKKYIVSPPNYKNIKGYNAILIDIVFNKINKFLDHYFYQVSKFGWVEEDINIEDIISTIEKLTSLEQKYANPQSKFYPYFPQTIYRLQNYIKKDFKILEIAIEMSNAFFLYKKMLHLKPISPRKVRTIRLFEILYNNNKVRELSSFDIFNIYQDLYNDDNCSLRDIVFLMDEFDNIFLNLYHNFYTVIEDRNDIQIYPQQDNQISKDIQLYNLSDPKEQDDSLKNLVMFFVNQKKAVFTKDVFKYLNDKVDAPGSAGYILKNSEFKLLAPGYYCLNKNYPDIQNDSEIKNKLMTNEQCRNYTLAKFAGENNVYPLWNIQMEYEWVKWASTNATKETYESILSICKPNDWDISKDEIDSWIDMKKRFSKFHFEKSIDSIFSNYSPSLENIFRILIYLKQNKFCNFISVNRIAKPLLFDDWKGSVILAILIKLKCLTSAEHWMKRHNLEQENVENLDNWITLFIDNFIYKKQITWNSDFGIFVINKLKEPSILSWINEEHFNNLLYFLPRSKN